MKQYMILLIMKLFLFFIQEAIQRKFLVFVVIGRFSNIIKTFLLSHKLTDKIFINVNYVV